MADASVTYPSLTRTTTASVISVETLKHGAEEQDKVGLHRADVLAVLPGGRHVMTDVTVVHPLGVNMVGPASKEYAAAAVRAEREKQRDWEAFADNAQYEFVPFGIESYGRLGPRASAYVRELGEIAASSGRISKSRFVMNAYRVLSCALQKWNGLMYAATQQRIARSVGFHFTPGYDVPVEDM